MGDDADKHTAPPFSKETETSGTGLQPDLQCAGQLMHASDFSDIEGGEASENARHEILRENAPLG
ncbi:hypothetical protein [Methylorubrum aminovorans]|uniref:hypothetical protein n=1 Tax=Methylorubrum aminovorans TaxID=269069 RepID=UPI001EDCBBD2|nr:hypothetical protein [Methylorubrum aminovorans]